MKHAAITALRELLTELEAGSREVTFLHVTTRPDRIVVCHATKACDCGAPRDTQVRDHYKGCKLVRAAER